jgi:EAL domain-containing protein (putative c-di-GMP-specific phosphodiesterase class I)
MLARHPEVSPALLEFEILESVALGDIHAMNALIESCRGLGIRFSLDDFGTGYSSLSYLKRIAVQTLKVDQSFVRDMLDDPDDLALVESIINIAKLFRLDVVAEGVESQRQGELLQSLGCKAMALPARCRRRTASPGPRNTAQARSGPESKSPARCVYKGCKPFNKQPEN